MKTHTIKTPTAELMIIEFADGDEYTLCYDILYLWNDRIGTHAGFKGSYTLLGKPDEIREEDAKELVESNFIKFWHPNEFDGYGFDKFKNYKTAEFSEVDATESLLSLFESEIYWDVNPVPKPDYFTTENSHIHLNTWSDFMHEWHEAEKKTFDRNRSIILVKN